MTLNFQEYEDLQESIVTKFNDEAQESRSQGLLPDTSVKNKVGGRLVAFKHPDYISKAVEDFSRRIQTSLRGNSIIYHHEDVHTTSVIRDITNNFTVPSHTYGDNYLNLMTEATHKVKNKIHVPVFDYQGFLHNRECVIAKGSSSSEFLEISNLILSECGEDDSIRGPYMSHISSSRFTEEMSSEEIQDFLELMKESPMLGKSIPVSLDVGYYTTGPEGFSFYTRESFKL